jgi:hypothetical protein
VFVIIFEHVAFDDVSVFTSHILEIKLHVDKFEFRIIPTLAVAVMIFEEIRFDVCTLALITFEDCTLDACKLRTLIDSVISMVVPTRLLITMLHVVMLLDKVLSTTKLLLIVMLEKELLLPAYLFASILDATSESHRAFVEVMFDVLILLRILKSSISMLDSLTLNDACLLDLPIKILSSP